MGFMDWVWVRLRKAQAQVTKPIFEVQTQAQ
jgi:hypothetical protein